MPGKLPPLRALHAFEAAARHSSFTRAAEELGVTPTAVRHHVRQIEQQLGFKLFRRTNNALILTDRGESYWPALNDAFTAIAEETQRMRGFQEPSVLTISARPNFALRWLVPRLPTFHPKDIPVEVRLLTSHAACPVVPEEIDIAVYTGAPRTDLRSDLLFEVDMFPVCSPEFLAHGPLAVPGDTLNRTRLHTTTSPDDWPIWLAEAAADASGAANGPKFDTFALALEAAAAGWGLAMARGPFVIDDLRSGRLIAPFDLRVRRRSGYHMVVRSSRRKRAALAFRAWILAEANKTRTLLELSHPTVPTALERSTPVARL